MTTVENAKVQKGGVRVVNSLVKAVYRVHVRTSSHVPSIVPATSANGFTEQYVKHELHHTTYWIGYFSIFSRKS